MAREISRDDDIRAVLAAAKTIAVLGAHCVEHKPACYVPQYLRTVGYRVIPVNPRFAGEMHFDEITRATLEEIKEPVDIVDVFRRSEHIPDHLNDIFAMDPLPKLVWFQLGIVNDEAARAIVERGIDVVQDRCTLADHQRLGLSPASRGRSSSP